LGLFRISALEAALVQFWVRKLVSFYWKVVLSTSDKCRCFFHEFFFYINENVKFRILTVFQACLIALLPVPVPVLRGMHRISDIRPDKPAFFLYLVSGRILVGLAGYSPGY
jgi:hypothetical protein